MMANRLARACFTSLGTMLLRRAMILGFLSVAVSCVGAETPSQGAKPGVSEKEANSVDIPWVKGAFRHVLVPPGQSSDSKKRPWYINDHGFFVDESDTIHWFGITNPYPQDGNLYGAGSHRHIGHASAKSPFGPWTEHEHAMALPEDTKETIGVSFVVRGNGEFLMFFNGNRPGFDVARSVDLNKWDRLSDRPAINLGGGTRDPCIVKQDDGLHLLYATAGHQGLSAVALGTSKDLLHWDQRDPALVSDIKCEWGALESPFVYRRNGAYYLFVNHSHHQYEETLVFASNNPYKFDWKNPLCTIFAHAAEIFEWKGKTYISHCGIEDRQWDAPYNQERAGLYLAELCFGKAD